MVDQSRQAGASEEIEIKVTEEMAKVGGREVLAFDWDREHEKEAAARIYRAMAALDHRRLPFRRIGSSHHDDGG